MNPLHREHMIQDLRKRNVSERDIGELLEIFEKHTSLMRWAALMRATNMFGSAAWEWLNRYQLGDPRKRRYVQEISSGGVHR